ncbi:unnamed protein product [Diatraea saccharalis]|uniref:Carboxylic ester hydrolase n=1 Tax=Diatraea saccharalis TaxID=40085 RepID=A0A9N9R1P1_9NEOP|nr:unnamed protein product [Diatraea saccharalis]
MVQVKTSDGVLEGEILENIYYGGKYYSFKGIPYAEPPVGDLRFKAPIQIKPWSGVKDAKKHGPICYQRDPIKALVVGSEDCLYLNVYSPNINPNKLLPVMVWIHGGAFMWGDGNDYLYGPEFIVRHDVILITINYRVGMLGFLCLDTKDIPGNAGMKDQVLALKWVKNNITYFGGDKDNITIFGESAGGASVSFHLVSQMTKGLFKRAIAQSGCSINNWAIVFEPREKALKFARDLDLYSEDEHELYEFFKSLPAEKLLDYNMSIHLAKKSYDINLGVVNEKDFGNNERFFYGDIFDILRNGIHEDVDIITGYTEDEGLFMFFTVDIDTVHKLSNNYLEFFVPNSMTFDLPLRERLNIGREIKKYYFVNGPRAENNFDGILRFVSMEMFQHDVITWAKFCANMRRNKIYFYKFTCKSERNQSANMFNFGHLVKDRAPVPHFDDVMYLFPIKYIFNEANIKWEELKLINNITTLWTNFAKYGDPTYNKSVGVNWLPYDTKQQNYLDIGNELVTRSFPDKEDVDMLDSIYNKYQPSHIPHE